MGTHASLKSTNFNHLFYFHIIAQEGSIAKASQLLNVTQPTLSQQLRQFETQIQAELFQRQGRSLELNSRGQFLYDYTAQIFEISEKMFRGFSFNKENKTNRTYKIGLTPVVSRAFAAHLLKPLFADSDIGTSVSEAPLHSLIKSIQTFELDFALSETPPSQTKLLGVKVEQLATPEYHFVCGKELHDKCIASPKELNGMPYFKYKSNNIVQQEINQYFYENQIAPNVIGESDDQSMMIAALQVNSCCFAVLPRLSVDEKLQNESLFSLGKFESHGTNICAIYHDEVSNSAVKDIVARLKGTEAE